MLTHMSLWSEFWLVFNGRYPSFEVFIHIETHIPYIGCLFWFFLVVVSPFLPCLLSMISLMPKVEKKARILFLWINSFMYLIMTTWPPSSLHFYLVMDILHKAFLGTGFPSCLRLLREVFVIYWGRPSHRCWGNWLVTSYYPESCWALSPQNMPGPFT